MIPAYRVSFVLLALTASAIAQPPQPPARAPQGPTRPTFPPVVIGPQAPVPAEVEIPRPTPDELVRVNAALANWVKSDTTPVQPLLEKFQSLMMLQPPRLNICATYTQTVQRMGARHLGFVDQAQQGNIDLLLDGDSITDFWQQNDANKEMYAKYFGQYRTANFGISGDTTQGLLWGLKNGEGQGFQPKAIMVMIGTNSAGTSTGPEIAEGVGAVVLEMRKDFPNAKILLLAIFPRGTPNDPLRAKLTDANKIISRLDDQKHVFYMDIGQKFLDNNGYFLTDSFRPDNLHPLAKGYDIWGTAVQEKLAELMK